MSSFGVFASVLDSLQDVSALGVFAVTFALLLLLLAGLDRV